MLKMIVLMISHFSAPLSEKKKDVIIRQDVDLLTEDEMNALRVAMENVQVSAAP